MTQQTGPASSSKPSALPDAASITLTMLALVAITSVKDLLEVLTTLGLRPHTSAVVAIVIVAWLVVLGVCSTLGAHRRVIALCSVAALVVATAYALQFRAPATSAAPPPSTTTSSTAPAQGGPSPSTSESSPPPTPSSPTESSSPQSPAQATSVTGSAPAASDPADPTPPSSREGLRLGPTTEGSDDRSGAPAAVDRRGGDGCFDVARHGSVVAEDTEHIAIGRFVSGSNCDGISIKLTGAKTYTWARACLQPVDGVDPEMCGPDLFLNIGQWDSLLDGQPGGTGWQLQIWTAEPSTLTYDVTG